MITSKAMHLMLNRTCRRAAATAFQRIQGYDLDGVLQYLDLMKQDSSVPSWKHSEIIATMQARTTSGCPNPDDPEQIRIMQQCFEEAAAG